MSHRISPYLAPIGWTYADILQHKAALLRGQKLIVEPFSVCGLQYLSGYRTTLSSHRIQFCYTRLSQANSMNRLVIGNLLHRPLRSAISILAVAIEVAMILSIVGILFGQIDGSRRQQSGIGADLIVRPPNASFIAGVSGAPIPAKVADVLRKLPHVAVASPAIQQLSVKSSVETIWGIDYSSFNALRPFVFLSGGPFQGPNDVIVDDIL